MIQLLKPLEHWDSIPTTGAYLEPRSWGAHGGIDKGAWLGTPIFAMHSGVTARRDYGDSAYGMAVTVHNETANIYSRYGHMSEWGVGAGEWVEPGQLLGMVGTTGNSTGPHLHVEGRYINTDATFDLTPHLVNEILAPGFTLHELKQRMEWAFQLQHDAVHEKMSHNDLPIEVQNDFRRAEIGVSEARGIITSAEAESLRQEEGL